MGYNSDSLWRIYQIGGADLALRYVDIAERSSRTSSGTREPATRSAPVAIRQFRLLGLRLYSDDFRLTASPDPTVARRFPARGTRRICFEANIENPWHYTSGQCDLLARCDGPDGKSLGEIRRRFDVRPDQSTFRYTDGWMPQALGKWDEGLYRVEVSVDGGPPTADTFMVFDDGPSMLFRHLLSRRGRRS